MALKTFIPGLTAIARTLIKYAGKYRAKVVENLGNEAATLLDLLLDIAGILVTLIEAYSDDYGNYDAPVSTPITPAVINGVRGAYNQFMAANGETGDI